MELNQISKLVEQCFELPDGSVSTEMISADIPDWDSLGHFALLEFIEAKYPGTIDANPGLAQASSIAELQEFGLRNIN